MLAGMFLLGCGKQEVDLEDELKGKEDYELVQIAESPQAEKQSVKVDTAAKIKPPVDTTAASNVLIPAEKAAPPIAYDPAGEYTVQVGSYDEARLASEQVRQLSAEGYPAYAIANTGSKGGRVRIGYFKTKDEAERFGLIFKKDKGTEFWVDRRANEKL